MGVIYGADRTPRRAVVPKNSHIKGVYAPNKPVCGVHAGFRASAVHALRDHVMTIFELTQCSPMAVAAEGEWIQAVQRVCSLLGAEVAARGARYASQ